MSQNEPTRCNENLRAIAYSMDLLIPGVYFWLGAFTLRLGGSKPQDAPYRYPGVIHGFWGIAVVLPCYGIITSYTGSYDA